MFQPAQVKVAGAGEKLQGDNSDSFFSLAQNIPINPHHPHHLGNFSILRALLRGTVRIGPPPSKPPRDPSNFARVLPEGAGPTGRARPPYIARQDFFRVSNKCFKLQVLSNFNSDHCQTGANPVQTFSTNSLAEQFEIDRGTMVRALKNVAPDAEKTPGRPTFKLSTASRALEAHRRSIGRVPAHPTNHTAVINEIDPRLQRHYDAFDQADASMRRLKTVEARRQAAIAMGLQIAKMDALQRQISLDNGIDQELTDLRSDRLFFLYLRGFETPCSWSQSETWAAVDIRE